MTNCFPFYHRWHRLRNIAGAVCHAQNFPEMLRISTPIMNDTSQSYDVMSVRPSQMQMSRTLRVGIVLLILVGVVVALLVGTTTFSNDTLLAILVSVVIAGAAYKCIPAVYYANKSSELRKKLHASDTDHSATKLQVVQLNGAADELQSQLDDVQDRLNRSEQRRNDTQEQLDAANAAIESYKARMADARVALDVRCLHTDTCLRIELVNVGATMLELLRVRVNDVPVVKTLYAALDGWPYLRRGAHTTLFELQYDHPDFEECQPLPATVCVKYVTMDRRQSGEIAWDVDASGNVRELSDA